MCSKPSKWEGVFTCCFHDGKIGIWVLTKTPVIDAILDDSCGSSGLLIPAITDVMGNLVPIRAILFLSDFKVVGPLRFLGRGGTANLSITSSYQGIYVTEHVREHVPNSAPPSSLRKKLSLAGLNVSGRSWLVRCWEPAVETGSAVNCSWVTGLATGGWGTCGLVFAPSTAFRPTDVGLGRSFLCWCFALQYFFAWSSFSTRLEWLWVWDLVFTLFTAFVCDLTWPAWTLFIFRWAVRYWSSCWTMFFTLLVFETSLREVPDACQR